MYSTPPAVLKLLAAAVQGVELDLPRKLFVSSARG